MTRNATRFQHMVEAFCLYLAHPDGLRDNEVAERLGCDRTTVLRIRRDLDGVRKAKRGYTIDPTPQHVTLAKSILSRK